MNTAKTILSTIALLLGLFVITAVIAAVLTFPQGAEPPAPAQALPYQPEIFEIPAPEETTEPENISTQEMPPSTTPVPPEIAAHAESALVNILCITTEESGLRPISGSGSIIDPRGVILTNAHIAQYFLLDGYAECVIRQGSPASARYTAELLYLPPIWVEENAAILTAQTPRGTGEHDYGFLLITDTISDDPVPGWFTSVTADPGASSGDIENLELQEGMSISVVGYPSEFLASGTVLQNLQLLVTGGTITKLFTFDTNTLDLLAIGGTVLAQQGVSGGAVIGSNGLLKALVVTATQDRPLGERLLQAITLGHIERSLKQERGGGISDLLTGDLNEKVDRFQTTLEPALRERLVQQVE